MRESNFAFPAQNKACVCITSQLYDRRALDTSSPLPLLNSLTNLTYLTSTSPRIREILTCDGGLERLVRILRDFCFSPPPPENPSVIFGLSPPGISRYHPTPSLNPKVFDRYAAYRFSLAFQCVVNVGVRGSEIIRARVVEAGTLDVVGCILEAWLGSKGIAVAPSVTVTGGPRETREQRHARRAAQIELRQREHAHELARLLALQRAAASEDEPPATSDTDTSAATTPSGEPQQMATVTVPGRERSGTIVARRDWDQREQSSASMARSRTIRARQNAESSAPSTSTSRPETETEDDGEPDNDVEMASQDQDTDENMPPRRAVGIVVDSPIPAGGVEASDALDVDAHIIINTNAADDGVSDGIVALDQNVNDDLALGAPPGAPGAIEATPRTRQNTLTLNTRNIHPAHGHHQVGREEMTPRAVLSSLPVHATASVPVAVPVAVDVPGAIIRGGPSNAQAARVPAANAALPLVGAVPGPVQPLQPVAAIAAPHTHRHHHRHHHHHHVEDIGPFREEDVLLSLQLLAYLSKYPHVRQAFYKPRVSFHPATALAARAPGQAQSGSSRAGNSAVQAGATANIAHGSFPDSSIWRPNMWARTGAAAVPQSEPRRDFNLFKSLTGRGAKEKAPPVAVAAESDLNGLQPGSSSNSSGQAASPPRMTNVFALVERYTFRPSPQELASPNPPPVLPHEIQYWAGVIMRNACRKDENQGGIRQCANMLCGKWETFPREFAKCRRCRKAKYCGKECQSRAWSEGHRFWCSAREADELAEAAAIALAQQAAAQQGIAFNEFEAIQAHARLQQERQERHERRQARERHRQAPTLAELQPMMDNRNPAIAAAVAALQPRMENPNNVAAAAVAATAATQEFLRLHGGRINNIGTFLAAQFGNDNGNPTGAVSAHTRLPDIANPIPVSVPINVRRRHVQNLPTAAFPQAEASQTVQPNQIPINFSLDLNAYSAQEQMTIRNFLQAVGISERPVEDAGQDSTMRIDDSGSVTGQVGENMHVMIPPGTSQDVLDQLVQSQRRASHTPREQRGGEERQLPERIQALEVQDRRGYEIEDDDDDDGEDDDEAMILG